MQISVNSITKQFGSFTALQSVSADFEQGGIYVIAGPNGAGKTTLLRIIAGLDSPTRGQVNIGKEVNLGVMMQETYLYPDLTPRENLKLYTALMGVEGERVFEVSNLFELEKFMDHEVATLSHGQRQRTALARALLGNPNVIIFDEPFLGLDTTSVGHALRALEAIKERGGIALVATHELEVVKGIADRLFVLESGRVKYFDRFNI